MLWFLVLVLFCLPAPAHAAAEEEEEHKAQIVADQQQVFRRPDVGGWHLLELGGASFPGAAGGDMTGRQQCVTWLRDR